MFDRFIAITVLTTLGLFGLVAATPAAAASVCGMWGCGFNGPHLNGVAVQGVTLNGIPLQRTELVLRKEPQAREKEEPKPDRHHLSKR